MYTSSELFVIPTMFLILLAITLMLWLLLRDKNKMVQNIPFIIITLALIGGEIAKQIISIRQGYDFWNLPLHFCSTYFIWFALAEFSFGEMRKSMQNIAFVATVYLAVGMYIAPRGILGSACDNIFADFYSAHSFFFHHLVILYSMLCIAFKRFNPKKRDAWVWSLCFAIYFAVAATCAYTFNENFFNILHSENIPPLEPFRLAVGQVVYNAMLAFVVIFLGAIFIRVAVRIRDKHFTEEEAFSETVDEKY